MSGGLTYITSRYPPTCIDFDSISQSSSINGFPLVTKPPPDQHRLTIHQLTWSDPADPADPADPTEQQHSHLCRLRPPPTDRPTDHTRPPAVPVPAVAARLALAPGPCCRPGPRRRRRPAQPGRPQLRASDAKRTDPAAVQITPSPSR